MAVLKNHDFECEITIICDYYRQFQQQKKKIKTKRLHDLLNFCFIPFKVKHLINNNQ